MSIIKFILKFIVLPVILFAAGALVSANFLIKAGKDKTANAEWFENGRGINETDYVNLGGYDQYIQIRGRDRSNPVLLDIHGGPGNASQHKTYRYTRPLAEYFTVVEWDQRGAGKSDGGEDDTVVYEDMVADAVELIEHLQERLGIEKVILVGHSWGSKLSIGVIQARPDLIHAYVGVGQLIGWHSNFDETFRLITEAATEAGDQETLDLYATLSDEWPSADDFDAYDEHIRTIQAPLAKYKGGIHAANDSNRAKNELTLDAMLSPFTEVADVFPLFSGGQASATISLVQDLSTRNIGQELGTDYQVPIFIFQGDHDLQTPTTLVKEWFPTLNAPYKEYVAFEDSAHSVYNEEPAKYILTLVNEVRPFALGERTPAVTASDVMPLLEEVPVLEEEPVLAE